VSSTSAAAGAVQSIAAVVACVALGAAAVLAHAATKTERAVAAKSRIADIMAKRERVRGKTSLKTYDQLMARQLKRNRVIVLWATLVLILLVIVMVILLLYASRALPPA
jgi:hypothetical protein